MLRLAEKRYDTPVLITEALGALHLVRTHLGGEGGISLL